MRRPCLECGRLIRSGSRCCECRRANAQKRVRPSTTERGYGSPWQKIAREVIDAQPWCTYCGTEGDPSNPLTADHFIAKAIGGTDDRDNLVTACRRCNSAKRDRVRKSLGR